MTGTATRQRLSPADLGKPRMRGWLHAYAFFVALVCGVVLVSVAAFRPGSTPVLSVAPIVRRNDPKAPKNASIARRRSARSAAPRAAE